MKQIKKFISWVGRKTDTNVLSLVRGSFWWITGKVGVGLLAFLSLMAFAHWLPKEEFGTYQYVLSWLALPAMFTLPGIDTSIVRSIARGADGTFASALRAKITWGFLATLIIAVFGAWQIHTGHMVLGIAFLIGAIFAPLREAFALYAGYWNGRDRFDIQAKYLIISAAVNTIAVVVAIYVSRNMIIILVAFLASKTLIDAILYRRTVMERRNDDVDPSAVSFGKHLTAMDAFETIAAYVDKIILWYSSGAVAVAVWSFAQTPIKKALDLLPVVPLALSRMGGMDVRAMKGTIMKKFYLLFVFTIPAAGAVALMAPILYRIFFPQYLDSVGYFQASALLIAFVPFSFLATALVVELRQRQLYILRISSSLLKIILFVALVPIMGIWGLVLGVLAGELCRGLLTMYYVARL
jgi:O-antigen/teichoic acid export membrane protein